MTKLEKIVQRETATVYRGRPLIIELHPRHLILRQKGKRHRVTLDYATAVDVAYKLLWKQEQAEKAAARKKNKAK